MNKKFTVLVGLLVAVVVTSYSVCGTYAKYTEDFEGTSSEATIATWDVSVNDSADNTFEFNLFDAIKKNNSLKDPDAELLAPGSEGSFEIKIANNSDVKVEATVSNFTIEADGVDSLPFKFKATKDGDYADLSSLNIKKAINDEGIIRIYYQWPYSVSEDQDEADTELGKTGGNITITANVTVSQVAA